MKKAMHAAIRAGVMAVMLTVLYSSPVLAVDPVVPEMTNSADVTIDSAGHYLLKAPWDGRILAAPKYGRVYLTQPMVSNLGELLSLTDKLSDDASIVRMTYPDSITDRLWDRDKEILDLASWLPMYGQPGTDYHPVEEPLPNDASPFNAHPAELVSSVSRAERSRPGWQRRVRSSSRTRIG